MSLNTNNILLHEIPYCIEIKLFDNKRQLITQAIIEFSIKRKMFQIRLSIYIFLNSMKKKIHTPESSNTNGLKLNTDTQKPSDFQGLILS